MADDGAKVDRFTVQIGLEISASVNMAKRPDDRRQRIHISAFKRKLHAGVSQSWQ